MTVRVDGARELRKRLKAAEADFQDLKDLHKGLAEVVAGAARYLVPRRSGLLASTIRSAGAKTSGTVRAGFARVRYAGVTHFGNPHRDMPPRPFLYDALDSRREKVMDAYLRGAQEIQQKHNI